MWTLILFTVIATGNSGGPSSTTISGFASRSNCEKTGYELVTRAPDTRYFYSQTQRPLFGRDTTQLYSVKYEIIRYGYQCVEVK